MNNILFIENKKFKNNAISLIIPFPLDDKVTDYNLIASILKRGCKKYKSTKDIWIKLQELYGAVFDIVISKKGESLFMNFYISFLDDRYTFGKEDLWKEAIDFLKEIIDNNYLEDGCFCKEYFDQEKENLKSLINSRIDDKTSYSVERVEEICTEGEPYSVYVYGNIDRLEHIKVEELTALWNDIKSTYPMYGFISGNFNEEKVKSYLSKISMISGSRDYRAYQPAYNNSKEAKIVKENMNVNQGKLSLCYRTNINIFQGDYFALAVMNSILGGGTHSKLFNEVREKNSLAYYSQSFIEKFKGILTITSGVNFENFDKTKDIIFEQIKNIQNGYITNQEVVSSKNKLITGLKTVQDSQYSLLDYIASLKINGVDYHIDDIVENIQKVTVDRVIEASNKLNLGAIHILDRINP